jgi:alkaline phosphatase
MSSSWSLRSTRCFLGLAITLALLLSASNGKSQSATNGAPKYIFLFLSDGGGITHLEIARQYRKHIHNEGMVIVDKIMKEGSVGVMTTHAANSLSTDSAAAAKPTLALSACAPTAPWLSARWSWRAGAA